MSEPLHSIKNHIISGKNSMGSNKIKKGTGTVHPRTGHEGPEGE